MNQNDFYKLKYHKYKNKYISLKNKNLLDQQGGIANNPGTYLYYVSIRGIKYRSKTVQKWNGDRITWTEQTYNLKHQDKDKDISSQKDFESISFLYYRHKDIEGKECNGTNCDGGTNNFREPCTTFEEQEQQKYVPVNDKQLESLFKYDELRKLRIPAKSTIKKYLVIEVKVNKLLPNEIKLITLRDVDRTWPGNNLFTQDNTNDKFSSMYRNEKFIVDID